MTHLELLQRVTVDPGICGGKPVIRGTRVPIAVILDGLAEGLSAEQISDHYPHLTVNDVYGALAYAASLAQEGVWKIAV
jgi:uncharacterized protein (DUF433 family)